MISLGTKVAEDAASLPLFLLPSPRFLPKLLLPLSVCNCCYRWLKLVPVKVSPLGVGSSVAFVEFLWKNSWLNNIQVEQSE
jgi:hypothetical protein